MFSLLIFTSNPKIWFPLLWYDLSLMLFLLLPTILKGFSTCFSSLFNQLCYCCCCYVASVMSDSVRPHRWQPTRLPCPWDSPSKNTGVGCHFLLQCMKVKSESEVAQSCLTLSNPMHCSPPGSSVHGIFQARVLEWVAIAFSANQLYWLAIWLWIFIIGGSLVAQLVKNPPAMQETLVWFLGQEDPLEEGMSTHSSILAWRIPMDRGAWWATVHGVAKSWTWPSDWEQHSTRHGRGHWELGK